MKVFSVAEMVAAEKAADAADGAGGLSYAQMMETAGKSVAEAVIARWPVEERTITVLIGPGNNGGDGLVAGRYLAQAGADVTFYLFKERDPEKDTNLAKVMEMGLFVLNASFDQRYRVLRTRLNITDIVIDALLGTGVSRPIGGELAKLMGQVQAGLDERRQILAEKQRAILTSTAALDAPPASEAFRQPIVVAVDCPSGLNCDNGAIDPLAVAADLTVTFAGPKRGHFVFPGAGYCGELVVADIGIDPKLPEVSEVGLELVTADTARSLLPPRPSDGHKGTFGSVLVAAGSANYWGAPFLAGKAAYRVGAGLVALAVPTANRPSLATQLPEATYPPISAEDVLDAESARSLFDNLTSYQSLLVGPGVNGADDFLTTLLTAESLPLLVIDADGLNILSRQDNWPELLPPNTILTPHPGEMARLMGVSLSALKEMERVGLAQKQAAEWGCVVLLKGAYTVVAGPDGRCALLPFANPALAVAGSGDVLSGIIAGLLGQGLASFEAAVLGGYLHGAAATAVGLDSGLLAGEISDQLPLVRQRMMAMK
ncbi:MAG: NAD(P)H-hydrate dehydratase [Candidatus Promineifilaceae bacterium]